MRKQCLREAHGSKPQSLHLLSGGCVYTTQLPVFIFLRLFFFPQEQLQLYNKIERQLQIFPKYLLPHTFRNPTAWSLFRLASFIEQHVFKFPPCFGKTFLFSAEQHSILMDASQLVYPVILLKDIWVASKFGQLFFKIIFIFQHSFRLSEQIEKIKTEFYALYPGSHIIVLY